MGVTIYYRGRLAEPTRIEDFEDRLVDIALELGGLARIWRSWPDDNPDRMVSGIILDLAPGHESTSLVVSPEGWLIGLADIKDAEDGRLKEPPWCFTKTQFGPVESHVAIVEMLAALKRLFLPDLEVSDDGGYWETHDLAALVRNRALTKEAIDGLAEGLRRHGLSREAAEDPDILIRHIERVTEHVHRILGRPAEHPPLAIEDHDDIGVAADPEATEKQWVELSKQNHRQQERMQRAIEERRSSGVDAETAFRDALRDVVPNGLDEESEQPGEAWCDDEQAPFGESFDDADAAEGAGFRDVRDDCFDSEEQERHPLLQQAMDLLVRFDTLFRDAGPRFAPSLSTLYRGAGDAIGGLAQALSPHDLDGEDYGLCIVQLKRALRGAAFARGALFPLRSVLSKEQFDDLFRVLAQMETDIVAELGKVRLI